MRGFNGSVLQDEAQGELRMTTVLFYATVKEGHVQAFHDHVVRLTAMTRAEDAGCLTYVFHQRQDNPREFML